ncbi:restriction endonuclease [Rodentibacter caecimuris]|uniref:restriction endonuclease n=1 Tax=Rodentibacter caecimuris TaxID=1796644 RepID=UPI002248E310|nr:restriction endonuclease [Rodentibacter heylii]MCX2962307.1 restriction endonuclease [Rodentibacter heylii]
MLPILEENLNSSSTDEHKIPKNLSADVQENLLHKELPEILEILLLDRTISTAKKPKNIIWANDNYYSQFRHNAYAPDAQISIHLITGQNGNLIMPRSLKPFETQKERTKSKAEVFTPIWVVKEQNDAINKNFKKDDLETYIKRKWLEIACGEAPYMTTRYDMETGKIIPLRSRVGFVDRKLSRINKDIQDKTEWQRLVELAYKASYGFEWNGDSLLLARENLLYTYRDYYFAKWKEEPTLSFFKKIAEIISYNVFQMDGLTCTIPLSQKKEKIQIPQMPLFDISEKSTHPKANLGKRVKIMNWETNKMEYFDKGVKNA